MKWCHQTIRKLRILAGFFKTKIIVAEFHSDGKPKTMIKYRGEDRFIREIHRRDK
jgi:hypothetical protein